MLKLLLSYWLLCLLVMVAKLFNDNSCFEKCDRNTRSFNNNMKEKLKNKQISPMVYKESLLDIKKERRECIIINLIIAPVWAPIILFTMILDIINYIKFNSI